MRKSDQQKALNDPAPLLGTGETTPSVLSKDMGSCAQCRPSCTAVSSAEGPCDSHCCGTGCIRGSRRHWAGSCLGSIWEVETSLLSLISWLEGVGKLGSVWSGCTYSEVHGGRVKSNSYKLRLWEILPQKSLSQWRWSNRGP